MRKLEYIKALKVPLLLTLFTYLFYFIILGINWGPLESLTYVFPFFLVSFLSYLVLFLTGWAAFRKLSLGLKNSIILGLIVRLIYSIPLIIQSIMYDLVINPSIAFHFENIMLNIIKTRPLLTIIFRFINSSDIIFLVLVSVIIASILDALFVVLGWKIAKRKKEVAKS